MGTVRWSEAVEKPEERKLWRMDVAYFPSKKKEESDLRAIFFLNRNLSVEESLQTFERLQQTLRAQGIESHVDILPPGDLRQFTVGGLTDTSQLRPLEDEIRNGLSATQKANVRVIRSENPLSLKVQIKDVLSSVNYEKLKNALTRTLQAQTIKLTLTEGANSEETPVLRVSTKIARLPEALQGQFTDVVSAENTLIELLEKNAFVPHGVAVQEKRDFSPLGRIKALDEWRRQNPAQATGAIYLIPNLLQALSGLVRGNAGEMKAGLFWATSNFDLAIGSRKRRLADDIVKGTLKQFVGKDGTLDLTKQTGFSYGDARLGTLVGDYLNWRETPGNDIASKALFAMLSGSSALTGGLKGKKTAVLDDTGNVVLDEKGLPKYVNVFDLALAYDGAATLTGYIPQLVFSAPRSGMPPMVDVSLAHKPVTDSKWFKAFNEAQSPDSPYGKVRNLYKTVENEPVRWTSRWMASRNILHIGRAGYQLDTLPHKHEAYSHKLSMDALHFLTPEGSDKSVFPLLQKHFGFDRYVDERGALIPQVRSQTHSFLHEYDVHKQEADTLKAKKKPTIADRSRLEELQDYLKQQSEKYQLALLLGVFDREDRHTKKGIPFIYRRDVPCSYDKLIAYHEAQLANPYNALQRGDVFERMYVVALNRRHFDVMGAELSRPWIRLVYGFGNLAAALQLGQIDRAEKKSANEAARSIDPVPIITAAAREISALVKDKPEDVKTAMVHRFAETLVGEMRVRRNENALVTGADPWTVEMFEENILKSLKGENHNPDMELARRALAGDKQVRANVLRAVG